MVREFTDTNQEVIDKSCEESPFHKGQLKREIDDLKGTLYAIYQEAKQSDGTVDLMCVSDVKITGDATERYHKVAEMHSILAGKRKRMTQIGNLEMGPDSLEDADPEKEEMEREAAKPAASYVPPSVSDEVSRGLRRDGYHGAGMWAEASRAKRTVNFDWNRNMHNIRAATLKITGTDVVQNQRLDGIVPAISNPVRVLEALPIMTANSSTVEYLTQATRTPAVTGKAEADALAPGTFTFSKATASVEKIGAYLPITDEMLEDDPGMRTFITNDLLLALRQNVDSQVTSGAGTSNTLKGLITYAADSGANNNVIGGANADVLKDDAAMRTRIDELWTLQDEVAEAGQSTPGFYAIDSNIWSRIVTAKNDNKDYLSDGPFSPLPAMIWGLPVIRLNGIATTVNTIAGFCASTDYIRLLVRREASIEFGYQATDFIDGVQTVRVSGRFGLMVQRLLSMAFWKRPAS